VPPALPVTPPGASLIAHVPAGTPRHVAIVMDGNGRWAHRRGMPRAYGHKAGVDNLLRIVRASAERRIEHLTVFAFSSENWSRPPDEVSALVELMLVAVRKCLAEPQRAGVRVLVAGERSDVSAAVREAIVAAEAQTAANRRMTLTVAFNYGGRWDIVQACRRLLASGIAADGVDEAALAGQLALAHAPDPDLFIRTGGELRVSNFLLWQIAYAELYFSDCLWPDFDAEALDAALREYARRERRFGTVGGQPRDVVVNG